MQEVFPAGQAARLSGVPYRTLDYWGRSGFFRPSVLDASGKGTDRLYSLHDLVALRVANLLRSQGMGLERLRAVVVELRGCPDLASPASKRTLIGDETRQWAQHASDGCPIWFGDRGYVWAVDISAIARAVCADVERGRPRKGAPG